MIDRDIHLARALLVEGNALMRSVTATQLRDAGVGQVSTAARIRDARLMLERESFDIVVCNREFEGDSNSGQDLLDELRRENLLPHSTVFLMITSQATYHRVMEAAEAALDGLLVRPFTAAALAQRLSEARKRKRELDDVLRALDAGQTERALVHAVKRFQEGLSYATYCGRLAAELFLNLQRPDEARRLFERLAARQPTTWARLGVVRALMAGGNLGDARGKVEAVIADDPASADAHDLLGRILVEQCSFDAALAEYRSAAGITPGCLLRVQHVGALAFYQGQANEALQALERALAMGVSSRLFDALTLALLAMLRLDAGQAAGVAPLRDKLRGFQSRFPDSRRLRRLSEAAEVLTGLAAGDAPRALQGLRALSAQAGDDDFDVEAANVVLALWARVPAGQCPEVEHEAVLERLALRFGVSRAMAEVLLAAAGRSERAQAVVRRCQAETLAVAEKAMDLALRGDADAAVRQLLAEGQRTLNAKLLDLAALLARKHQDGLQDAATLAASADAMLRRSCRGANHIAGIERSGRAPGGLRLRSRSTEEEDHATT